MTKKRYNVNTLPMMRPMLITVDVTINAALFREMLKYLDVHTIAAMRDDLAKACIGGAQIGGVSGDLCLLAKYMQQHMTEVWPLYALARNAAIRRPRRARPRRGAGIMINLKTRIEETANHMIAAREQIELLLAEPAITLLAAGSLNKAAYELSFALADLRSSQRELTAAGVEAYQIDLPIVEAVTSTSISNQDPQ